jgi:hypothetical protein
MDGETDTAGQKAEHRIGNRFLLVLGGLIGTLAITVPLHWNNAFFVLAGSVLPVLFGTLLARVSRYRIGFPGLIGLVVTLVGILILSWMARYPNPNKAFAEVMGTAVPESVRGLSAKRGWFDGRITILRFTADPDAIRALIPPKAEVDLLAKDDQRKIEDEWKYAVGMGAIIDSSLLQFPGWTKPRRAEWPKSPGSSDGNSMGMIWDEASGSAVVCMHED